MIIPDYRNAFSDLEKLPYLTYTTVDQNMGIDPRLYSVLTYWFKNNGIEKLYALVANTPNLDAQLTSLQMGVIQGLFIGNEYTGETMTLVCKHFYTGSLKDNSIWQLLYNGKLICALVVPTVGNVGLAVLLHYANTNVYSHQNSNIFNVIVSQINEQINTEKENASKHFK